MNDRSTLTTFPRLLRDIPLLLLTIVGAIAIFNATLNHDVAWFLYGAGRMLDGAKLYRDIIEVNPPLAFYVKLPVVVAARLFDLPVIPTFKVYIVLLICASLLACRLLIDRALGEFGAVLRGLFLLLLSFSLFATTLYGQREHLMLLLVMPYILAAMARVRGESISRSGALVIGIAAGLGLAFKPYFLLLWIGIEVYVAMNAGRRMLLRPENIGIAAILLLYALSVLLITPEYITLARTWVGVYRGYDSPPAVVFLTLGGITWYVAVLIYLIVRPVAGRSPALTILFIAATALELAAFVQFKGWAYHFYPASVLCRLFFLVAGWLVRRLAGKKVRVGETWQTAIAIVVTAGFIGAKLYQGVWRGAEEVPLLPVVQQYADGEYLAVLSTDVVYSYPLMNYSGMTSSLRYNSLWLLPGLYADTTTDGSGIVRYRDRSQMGEMERAFVDAIVTDLQAHTPSLLIVDRTDDMQGFRNRRFDLFGYFAQDERFRRLLHNYDSVATWRSHLVLKRRWE